MEHGGDEGEGKADDVEVVALDAGDPASGEALDGVGSGFIHGLAGGDVGVDVFVGECEEADGGDFGGDFGAGGGDDGDAGDDVMGAAGEKTEHAGGVGLVFGFAEDVAVEGDGGVGAEHLKSGRRRLRAIGFWSPTLSPEERPKGGPPMIYRSIRKTSVRGQSPFIFWESFGTTEVEP